MFTTNVKEHFVHICHLSLTHGQASYPTDMADTSIIGSSLGPLTLL